MKAFPLDPWIQTAPSLDGDSKEESTVLDTSMGGVNCIGTVSEGLTVLVQVLVQYRKGLTVLVQY